MNVTLRLLPRVCQPVSVYIFSTEVNLVVTVTILAASFWISSSSFCSKLVKISKIRSPYSNSGPIKDKYIVSNDLLSSVNVSDLMTCIRFQAFSVTYLMCVLHKQSLDKIIPMCLCSGTFICWFCINRGGWSGLFIVLEINIDSVLVGLKVTSHY